MSRCWLHGTLGVNYSFLEIFGDNYSLLWPKCTSEMAYYVTDLDD